MANKIKPQRPSLAEGLGACCFWLADSKPTRLAYTGSASGATAALLPPKLPPIRSSQHPPTSRRCDRSDGSSSCPVCVNLKASRFSKPPVNVIEQPLHRVPERRPRTISTGVNPCVAPSTATMVLSLVFVAWARIISSGLMK
jgi:hypothetical protein